VAPSLSGTLSEYAHHLQSRGERACPTADGHELWVNFTATGLIRLPATSTSPVSRTTARELLRTRGIWVLDYLLEPDDSKPPNAFLYLCRDPDYDLMRLSKNGRKAVRRGLKNVQVRRVSWTEVVDKGYAATMETDRRHGIAISSEAEYRVRMKTEDSPFYELWGAWEGEDLVAWLRVLKVDDWACIVYSPSRDSALHTYANNAMRYETLRELLTVEKRREVCTGLTGITPDVPLRTLHVYNTRMGFEAVPVHREFAARWWLRWSLANRPAAWFWAKMAKRFSQVFAIHRMAGLARFMAGVDRHPLAWADAQDEEAEEGD
jgi:hypothetical protein